MAARDALHSDTVETERRWAQAPDRASEPDALAPAARGEMATSFRTFDWASTELGPVERWPRSLIAAVDICLASRFPLWIGCGPQLRFVYNDAFRPVMGVRHPAGFGAPLRELWHEVWDVIGPLAAGVMERGESSWYDDQLLVLERSGWPEETYFTYSYSPIREPDGERVGMFVAVTETTERVISARRLRTLGDLAAVTPGSSRGEAAAREAISRVLAESEKDIPFALVYLVDPAGRTVELAAHTVAPGTTLSPALVDIAGRDPGPWPLRTVLETGLPATMDAPEGAPGAPWPEPARTVLMLPLRAGGHERAIGALVAGVSPRLPFDARYREFLDLVAGHVTTAIMEARALEAERKRAHALAELDRAKTTFFSNVSHEFRTPLTLLLGPVEEMLESHLTDPERERIEMAHRNALRLLRLVNALLDFARIESGRVEPSYEHTDIATLTADVASTFRSAVERAGLRLSVDAPALPERATPHVDREMWEKIVLNLLSNALKFTLRGEIAVTVRPAEDSRKVVLTVRDTGTGIPPADLPRIFERFHRIQGTRARTHEGSGIGLALVHELVRLHGGTIDVESEVDRGTTFAVRIPVGVAHLTADRVREPLTRAPSGAQAYVEEALRWLPGTPADAGEGVTAAAQSLSSVELTELRSADRASGRPRVLVVDDNMDMRAYVARLLAPGYEVETAPDGAAALAAVRAGRPDLVLADVMMPVLDGFGLLRTLRAEAATRDIPVVMLSARAGDEARIEGIEAAPDDYLVKPFAARELLARVATHLSLARMRAETVARERSAREDAQRLARQNADLLAQAREQTRSHVALNAALREVADDRDRARATADAARRRLHDLFMQAPASIAVLRGPEHVYELANPPYLRLIGRRGADDVLGKRVRDVLPEVEAQGYLALLDRVYGTGEPFVGTEMPARLDRRGDGTLDEVFVNAVLQPYRDAAGRVEGVLAHAVDVTEQVRAREAVQTRSARLALQYEVARVLAEAGSLGEAAAALVPAITRTLGWRVGAFWTIDPKVGALRCAELWHQPGIDVGAFAERSRAITLASGVGLPGRVWASGTPAWIPDVTRDGNFPRAPFALACGLHAAFGFPVVSGGGVLGVMEFFSPEIREPDQDLLDLVRAVGQQLGQFVERQRTEAALREAQRR